MKRSKRIIAMLICVLFITAIICIPASATIITYTCSKCSSTNVSANTSGCGHTGWHYMTETYCGDTYYQALMTCNNCGQHWMSNYTDAYYHCYFTNPNGKQECLLCGHIIN